MTHFRSVLSIFCPSSLFFFNDPEPNKIYTLSLHDALPIWPGPVGGARQGLCGGRRPDRVTPVRQRDRDLHPRSEEHTSELQSRSDLVCRLLLEKKKWLSFAHQRINTPATVTIKNYKEDNEE